MSPILDLQRRLHQVGRIRIGAQVQANGGKSRPAKLDTLRFTSPSEDAIKYLARLYGGECKRWDEAPVGKEWEVLTQTSAVRVMVPPEAMGFSQWYELWTAAGCQRRCDGNEQQTGDPCACDPEERECKPHTRLSVMLADMPTSGLWRLDSSGYYASTELAGGFELARLISAASGRQVLGATLRLEQRQSRRPGQDTRKYPVPVLDFDVDPGTLIGEDGPERIGREGLKPVPALPAPSFAEQLDAVDNPPEKPARANAAQPVKPTGLRPRPARLEAPKPEEADAKPEAQPVAPVDPPPNGPTRPEQLAQFFATFTKTPGASQRWLILRSNGWTSDDGKEMEDVAKWAAAHPERIDQVFEALVEMQRATK